MQLMRSDGRVNWKQGTRAMPAKALQIQIPRTDRVISIGHGAAMVLASLVGISLLIGMLWGKDKLPESMGIPDKTVRQTCIALWVFLLPLWFTMEERWLPDAEEEIKQFRRTQQFARQIWTAAGGAVAIIIGLSVAPDGSYNKDYTSELTADNAKKLHAESLRLLASQKKSAADAAKSEAEKASADLARPRAKVD